MAFSISVHHSIVLKATIQIFKNSVFSFSIYPHHCFTHSLSASIPIPISQELTVPIPIFPCGPGARATNENLERLYTYPWKMTVTKIERDQKGRHPSPQVFQGCMGRVPWVPYGGYVYVSNLAIFLIAIVFISDNSAKNYLCSCLSKFLAKFHCCKKVLSCASADSKLYITINR